MGALKPWHVLILLFCMAVVVTVTVSLLVAALRGRRK